MMRLFAVLLIVLLSIDVHSHVQYIFMDAAPRRQIPLKGGISNAEEDLIMRFPDFSPVKAFVDGSNLQLEFRKLPCTVEVSIVNAQTDELVYSEFCIATDNVVISLDELKRGEYRLEVSLDENTILLYGDFVF